MTPTLEQAAIGGTSDTSQRVAICGRSPRRWAQRTRPAATPQAATARHTASQRIALTPTASTTPRSQPETLPPVGGEDGAPTSHYALRLAGPTLGNRQTLVVSLTCVPS